MCSKECEGKVIKAAQNLQRLADSAERPAAPDGSTDTAEVPDGNEDAVLAGLKRANKQELMLPL